MLPTSEFAESIARHFAMLFTARALQPSPAGLGGMSLQELNPLLCFDALLAVLEEGKLIQQKAALHFLGVMLNTLVTFARARHMQAHGPAPGTRVSHPARQGADSTFSADGLEAACASTAPAWTARTVSARKWRLNRIQYSSVT